MNLYRVQFYKGTVRDMSTAFVAASTESQANHHISRKYPGAYVYGVQLEKKDIELAEEN